MKTFNLHLEEIRSLSSNDLKRRNLFVKNILNDLFVLLFEDFSIFNSNLRKYVIFQKGNLKEKYFVYINKIK